MKIQSSHSEPQEIISRKNNRNPRHLRRKLQNTKEKENPKSSQREKTDYLQRNSNYAVISANLGEKINVNLELYIRKEIIFQDSGKNKNIFLQQKSVRLP